MQLFVQMIIWCIKPKYKLDFIDIIEKPDFSPEKENSYFFGLLLVRHLFISFLLLSLAFLIYSIKFKLDNLGFSLTLFCFLFSIIHLSNYFSTREKLKLIQDKCYREKTKQDIQKKINKSTTAQHAANANTPK